MVIGTAIGLHTVATVALSVALAFSLAVAFVVAAPVNRWMIAGGKGHAVAHSVHAGHGSQG